MSRPVDPGAGGAGEAGGIAIVGVAGRFPGAADPEALWRMLVEGRGAYRTLSPAELDGTIHRDLARDPAYVPVCLTLTDHDRFDAAFFGYTPREAAFIDPQQRVLLECAWHAFEAAGRVPGDGPELRSAVFASVGASGYHPGHVLPRILRGEADWLDGTIGTEKDYAATRIAHRLGLTGAALSVQTACSSSLVAVHLACQALLACEADQALVAAAAIPVPLGLGYLYQPSGIHARDGRCRPFDAAASGTVFGAGAAAVLLRRVEDALADGDPVLAVIRGSAINNDGAGRLGFIAPGIDGQARAISEALAVAGLDAAAIGYVECHGTGTALGDPVEIAALDQAFRTASAAPERLEPGRCTIGAIKSQIGHLDVVAGLAGLIKAAFCVSRGLIPGTLHFETPNPTLGLDRTPFRVSAAAEPWRRQDGPRFAGVSSFGFGGTNAHVVLGQAPPRAAGGSAAPTPRLLTVSAQDVAAADRLCAALARDLGGREGGLDAVAATLRRGRKDLRHRRFVVAASTAEAARVLAAGPPGLERPETALPLAFLFPGQGTRVRGAALSLAEGEPAFRRHLDAALGALRAAGGPDVGAHLRAADAAEDAPDTARDQPALFALEYALGRFLLDEGLRPAAMIGHSVGEYAAACLAGVFTLADAARLVVVRGRAMAACPEGAMLVVAAPAAAVASLCADLGGDLGGGAAVAAVNAPDATVVGGTAGAIEAVAAAASRRGWPTRRLRTAQAFHTAAMAPALAPLREALAGVRLGRPALPIVSTATGRLLTDAEAASPAYWLDQILAPVRFLDAVAGLTAGRRFGFLEVGPPGGLARFASAIVGEAPGLTLLPAASPESCGHRHVLQVIGRLWQQGQPVGEMLGHPAVAKVVLPAYPFARDRHWLPDAYGALLAAFAGAGGRADEEAPAPSPPEAVAYQDRPAGLPAPVPPASPREGVLAGLWEDLLFLRPVGRDDDLFTLGADSILILRFAGRAREAGLPLAPADVFEARTVAGLARRLDGPAAAPAGIAASPDIAADDLERLLARFGGSHA